MRIVVALGGNALLRRGTPMTMENQVQNITTACRALAPLATEHELVITHGNGPQVGLLALQAAAYDEASAYPFDVLGAQTEGLIGYLIEREIGNLLPADKPVATVLTMTEVHPDDPAFDHPSKFVGPVYSEREADHLRAARGWVMKLDGDSFRRVVPSPAPYRIFELRPVKWLLAQGTVVICTGGGGIPTMFRPGSQTLVGVEAVVDKDSASAVLARDIDAHLLIIATDADAVYQDWGSPAARAIRAAHPDALDALEFAPGSMGPKVKAATTFARSTGNDAVIGALGDLEDLIAGRAGTRVSMDVDDISFRVPPATVR